MKLGNDTFALVQRMRAMVYSSKDFESLWFLYQAEGVKKTHKKVYPVTVTGNPAEDVEIQTEVEKVSR